MPGALVHATSDQAVETNHSNADVSGTDVETKMEDLVCILITKLLLPVKGKTNDDQLMATVVQCTSNVLTDAICICISICI